jgi:hypothetical protein
MGWQVMIRGKYSQKYVIICLSPLLRYATLCYAMLRYATHRTQERSNMVQSICRVMDGRLVILLDPGAMTCDDKLNRWVF